MSLHFRRDVWAEDTDLEVIWDPEIFEAGWDYPLRLFKMQVDTNSKSTRGETLKRKLKNNP